MPELSFQPINCFQRKAFTLVELICTLAIIALLVAVLVPFVGGMVSSARQTRDKQTLTILNDALTRYKCEGGDVNALTSSAPIASVIARLQADTTWCGLTHSFLQKGKTYISRSIYAKGEKAQYRFTAFNTYTAEAGGTSPTSLTNGLVGYWKLDAANGGTDLSGNGNNGAAQGGLTFGTAANHKGETNGATSFDGVNDKVDLNSAGLNLSQENAFTISAWVNPNPGSDENSIFARGGVNTSAGSEIFYISSNYNHAKWLAEVSDGTSNIGDANIGAVSHNEWQHIIVIWNGTNLSLYKNGAVINSYTGVFNGLWDGDDVLDRYTSIGADARNNRYYWNGLISDVRIYNRALSAAEVLQLYNQ